MKGSQIFGIIIAIALIVFAVAFPIPEKYLRTSSYGYDNTWMDKSGAEYVGGDAYNYQMEASLKAGYMGGVLAMKSISFIGGLLLFFLTLYSRIKCVAIEEQSSALSTLAKSIEREETILQGLAAKMDKQTTAILDLSEALNKKASFDEEGTTT